MPPILLPHRRRRRARRTYSCEPLIAERPPITAAQKAERGSVYRRVTAPFASLAIPNFRYLWIGQVCSATGMHADVLARSWLVWEITGSFTAVAAVNVARGIPMLAFGLFGGVIADRFNRKKALLAVQSWTMLMHASMAALILLGLLELWHVYALAFLVGIGMAMNQPIRTSIIPQLVGKSRTLNAITLNSMAINGTRFVGPAAVAFIISWADVGAAYVVSACMYLLVTLSTSRIRLDGVKSVVARANMIEQLLEGFRFLAGNRLLLTLVLLGLGPLAIGIAHRALLPGLVTDVLGQDVEMLGILQSAGAAGSLAAAMYLGAKSRIANRGYMLLGVTALYGLALLAMGGATALWMAMPLYIVSAMSQTMFRAANTSMLMDHTPDRLRGRIVSMTLIDQSLSPAAAILAGIAADRWGVGAGFILLGAGILAVVALAATLNPRLRHA